jgi:hypothetical protein
MKRPEVLAADAPALIADAYGKALGRGYKIYATCNFADIFLWRTSDGPRPTRPILHLALAPGLANSWQARARRGEIEENWSAFLTAVEHEISSEHDRSAALREALPPQVSDLQRGIKWAAEEAHVRWSSLSLQTSSFVSKSSTPSHTSSGLSCFSIRAGALRVMRRSVSR